MTAAIGQASLFDGLEAQAVAELMRIFERVEFCADDSLVRQGHPADSAFVVISGLADVVTALPGGGTAPVAQLKPGSVLGEMALLDSGHYSATVLAREAMVCYRVSRDGFRMLLSQRVPAVFEIQGRITRTLCRRLRSLNVKVMAADEDDPDAGDLKPVAVDDRVAGPAFDVAAFLPVLPMFRDFSAAETAAVFAAATVVRLRRGERLFGQGAPAQTAWIVVRGALELTAQRDSKLHRIGILGPGRFCGILAMIEGEPHSMQAVARENATLLALDRAAFARFFEGHDAPAMKLQRAINRELLQALARTNNHLTRLISRSRVRGKPVTELQCALAEQDCRQE